MPAYALEDTYVVQIPASIRSIWDDLLAHKLLGLTNYFPTSFPRSAYVHRWPGAAGAKRSPAHASTLTSANGGIMHSMPFACLAFGLEQMWCGHNMCWNTLYVCRYACAMLICMGHVLTLVIRKRKAGL